MGSRQTDSTPRVTGQRGWDNPAPQTPPATRDGALPRSQSPWSPLTARTKRQSKIVGARDAYLGGRGGCRSAREHRRRYLLHVTLGTAEAFGAIADDLGAIARCASAHVVQRVSGSGGPKARGAVEGGRAISMAAKFLVGRHGPPRWRVRIRPGQGPSGRATGSRPSIIPGDRGWSRFLCG